MGRTPYMCRNGNREQGGEKCQAESNGFWKLKSRDKRECTEDDAPDNRVDEAQQKCIELQAERKREDPYEKNSMKNSKALKKPAQGQITVVKQRDVVKNNAQENRHQPTMDAIPEEDDEDIVSSSASLQSRVSEVRRYSEM